MPMKARGSHLHSEERRTALLALLPSMAVFLVFTVYPIVYSLYLSLFDVSLLGGARTFVGLGNYIKMFSNTDFRVATANTIKYAVGTVPLGAALSMFVAVLLNQKIRGRTLYRIAYFSPVVTSMVAVAIVWIWLLDPYYGLVNALLGKVGISGPEWLASPRWAMVAMIALGIWKSLGYNMVIFLAGLQDVPVEYYESAEIDGANAWQKFRYVTLPLMRGSIGFVMVTSIIKSFQVFGQVYVMTSGGPMNSTMVLVYYIYRQAFEFYRSGYASAVAWFLFAVILVLTVLQRSLLKAQD
ncbi:MAG: Lactose transport system permease protein LacF [Firmicutes bacterium ADurb.Bin506]|jgi:multiple sugar transport system permease protein|nr:MAG: Lactose transport system permease protein LacF [Firmicutes bacterium ADurb.Bin506]